MDPASFLAGTASGLIVGLIGGWFAYALARRGVKEDRKLTAKLERIDQCTQIVIARTKYVVAYHRGGGFRAVKDEYLDLQRRYRDADPELFLRSTPEWEAFVEAQKGAMRDKATLDPDQRIKSVEAAAIVVLDALARRREKVEG